MSDVSERRSGLARVAGSRGWLVLRENVSVDSDSSSSV